MSLTLQALKNRIREALTPVTLSSEQIQAETRYLLEHVLGLDNVTLLSEPFLEVSKSQEQAVNELLRQRVEQRTPIQYLTSQASFYGLTLCVTPDVLIPRPETELLVDEALALSGAHGYESFLDIGTGSGAIALALASQLPESTNITATDVSPQALAVAQQNAQALGLSEQVIFRKGHLFEPVRGETFDVILSNPPYIDPVEREELAPEVRDHEPALALFSPSDALHFYQEIATRAETHLKPGGVVIVELGAELAEKAQACFLGAGFGDIRMTPDYSGIERILTAFR